MKQPNTTTGVTAQQLPRNRPAISNLKKRLAELEEEAKHMKLLVAIAAKEAKLAAVTASEVATVALPGPLRTLLLRKSVLPAPTVATIRETLGVHAPPPIVPFLANPQAPRAQWASPLRRHSNLWCPPG
jgi:hypothetical protein